MFKFPYTSFEKINLDWIMKTLNQLKDAIPLVQQASTVYNQALEALADAETAVETVTDQAAAAVTTANAANATAAQANQRAAYAETDAQAASANASTAQATAQSASDIATTARETALSALANSNQALSAALWDYKTWIYTAAGQSQATVDTLGKSTLLLFAFDALPTYGKEIFIREIPLSMYIDKQGGATDGDTDGYQWTIHNNCTMKITKSGNNITAWFATYPNTGFPNMYCHIFAR